MKILICDDKRINYYKLPDNVKDFFVITYTANSIAETITLEANEGKWIIKSKEDMQIYEYSEKRDQVEIEEYSKYTINFKDTNTTVYLHAINNYEKHTDISTNNSDITIGSANTSNIIYNDQSILQSQITITNSNGKYIITNQGNTPYLYVNSKKVNTKTLKFGDTIFISGLKLIWLQQVIRINNPHNSVTISGLTTVRINSKDMSAYKKTNESERNTKLYSDEEIFFHTPRLQSVIYDENIKIENPPQKEDTEKTPMILTIGSSAIIGITSCMTGISAVKGIATHTIETFDAIIELTMCALMLVASTLFPILTESWQKKQSKKREERRQNKYKEYLKRKVDKINEIVTKQGETIRENNITLEEIKKRLKNKSSNIWCREIIDDDFLNIRLGTGDLKAHLTIEAQIEEFSLYDDNLKDEVEKIISEERTTKNVPITISLVKNKITPFIINSNFKQNYIDSIMLQLLYYYSGLDLKIVIFTNKDNESKWDYIKYTPHNFSNDRKQRFFASNENEILQVSLFLEQEYDKRLKENKDINKEEKIKSKEEKGLYKNYSEYYLIITDDFKEVKNTPIINRIISSNLNIGYSIMIIEDSLNSLPSRLEKFIDIGSNISGIYNRSLNGEGQVQFKPEYINLEEIKDYSKIISNIPINLKGEESSIPTSLTFLDMYGVGRVDQLNILSRWKENNPVTSLNAQLGVKKLGKPIGLDLHEKYHGPHGLIAGSTGSGKSEFIITYILSMAVNYHPDEVQFVLIDYKGGGLAGAFENKETQVKLPHLVGTITNLDTSEMHRTLVSIQSEMKKRQIKFNEARELLGEGTIDIYKYQTLYREGKVKEPIAHLFVISDEFAELKQQNPDFMNELISTARIGRSLGVHLILATQKPSGVVDDQIWSNSHFKICLKVQTTEDSMEMLKKPDASEIKETGRFYLQVGNDELYELGQSAWAGAKYIPVDRVNKKINDSIDFISNDGSIIKEVNNTLTVTDNINHGEQLTNIVKYLYDIAKRENIEFKNLWLPNIPKDIYIDNLIKKYNYQIKPYDLNPLVGEYDKPAKQLQGLYTMKLNSQNTIIYGMPGSGKENLIQTMIYMTCICHSPNEVNFYILDFGSEALSILSKMPQVGDFITSSDQNKAEAEFDFLENEIRKRKTLFSNYSGNYETYCKESGKTLPVIVTIINTFETFMENYSNLEDYFIHLLREGNKYGIVFIMNVVSTNSVRSSILEYFNNKIILQTTDPFDYQYILGAPQGTVPSKLFGRGLTKIDDEICEFQTASIAEGENVNMVIKNTAQALLNKYGVKAPDIKIMPKTVKLDNLFRFAKSIDKIPIGYSKDRVQLTYYDFYNNKTTMIIGETIIEDITFMTGIIDLIDSLKTVKLNIFDIITCIQTDGNMTYYNTDFQSGFNQILTNNDKTPTVNIFIGLGDFKNNLTPQEQTLFILIMNNLNKLNNQSFIFIDDYNRFLRITDLDWFKKIDNTKGIWYGKDLDFQTIFEINGIENYENSDIKDAIYTIKDKEYETIKGIGKDEEELF